LPQALAESGSGSGAFGRLAGCPTHVAGPTLGAIVPAGWRDHPMRVLEGEAAARANAYSTGFSLLPAAMRGRCLLRRPDPSGCAEARRWTVGCRPAGGGAYQPCFFPLLVFLLPVRSGQEFLKTLLLQAQLLVLQIP
jgi:hypothetical protein